MDPENIAKLTEIFSDADFDNTRYLNQIKSANFNKYLEPLVTKEVALRDANDFIESCAIFNKDSVFPGLPGMHR